MCRLLFFQGAFRKEAAMCAGSFFYQRAFRKESHAHRGRCAVSRTARDIAQTPSARMPYLDLWFSKKFFPNRTLGVRLADENTAFAGPPKHKNQLKPLIFLGLSDGLSESFRNCNIAYIICP